LCHGLERRRIDEMFRCPVASIYHTLAKNPIVRGLRRVPFIGALVHATSHALLPWNTRIWVEVNDGLGKGLRLRMNPRYDTTYWDGAYEQRIQEIFAKHVTSGAIVYDIGANIGFFSLLAARLAGIQGKVFAFEPDPDNAARIREHIQANQIHTVTLVTAPVWSSSTRVFFARSTDHSSRLVGTVQASGETGNGFFEQAVSLDEFASTHPAPTFIKMDIEGGETEALAGATHMFEKSKPLLLLEVHNSNAEEYVKKWLTERAYSYEPLENNSTTLPFHVFASPIA
jgi:FkbM family methyltransferase